MSIPPFGRFPLNNTTPFTFRDSYTFLELLNEFLETVDTVEKNEIEFKKAVNAALADINTKTNKGKEITVTDKEMEAIVLKLLNFKITANGKNQELVQHMAESFVDDEAQSKALAEISAKLSALTNQVAEIRKAVR